MTVTKTGWWKVNFELNLEGEDVRFEDLSDTTKEYILERISKGFIQGEILELEEEETEEYQLMCGGEAKSLEWCEENCPRYYSCQAVAEAQDADKEAEDRARNVRGKY